MMRNIAVAFILLGACLAWGQKLPTVYEYFTEGGITSGLEAIEHGGFVLNGKNISIYSGAIHYFRVHPQHWRDRLRKLRAAGFLAVETYVPWNLHEPEMDVYDFGDGGRDMSMFLDLRTFFQIAKEEDLLVIFRPGPYICAEWVMGGLPSWLLRIEDIKMRTSDAKYTERVKKYFDKLLPLVEDLQFTNNGPIIAVQLENEFSSVSYPNGPDDQHLRDLEVIMKENGVKELLFTSDSFLLPKGTIDTVLRTINLQTDPLLRIGWLKASQPNLPVMVTEFWTGWYDHWFNAKSGRNDFTADEFKKNFEILLKYPASVNLYMFIGGTSWGFMNGANAVINKASTQFDVTSYDYGAPLSEAGDYTEKYYVAKDLLDIYGPVKFFNPEMPAISQKVAYPTVEISQYMDLKAIYNAGPSITIPSLMAMEELPVNNGSGQSYGYVWYRQNITINKGDVLKIFGHIHDAAQIFVDGKLQTKVLTSIDDIEGFGYWKLRDGEMEFLDSGSTLDIIVENMGRVNFGLKTYQDNKGIFEAIVKLNEDDIYFNYWEAMCLEFKQDWVKSLTNDKWQPFSGQNGTVAPGLYKGILELPTDSDPADTFISSSGWTKGIILINGFNLGRFNKLGPQLSLYLPGPLLRRGRNEIIIFEQFVPGASISFSEEPLWN